ncbi:MAG: hypothetical protein JWM61_1529, partial [Micrococcaceae bacterium]|nr:hypothetical protein [Micrococcaceae bacterium]
SAHSGPPSLAAAKSGGVQPTGVTSGGERSLGPIVAQGRARTAVLAPPGLVRLFRSAVRGTARPGGARGRRLPAGGDLVTRKPIAEPRFATAGVEQHVVP